MPAISNLAQIAGDVAEIKILGTASKQPNPFNILLLGDGFTDHVDDQTKFDTVIHNIKDFLFKVPPFRYCKPYINILYCFLASQNQGVNTGVEEWGAVFNLHIAPNGFLEPRDLLRPVEIVRKLSLPEELGLPEFLSDPDKVWFNHGTCSSYGAVCIISNNIEGKLRSIPDYDFVGGTISPWRYFIINLKGLTTDSTVLSGNYLHTFVHELGHSFDLGDEYEFPAGSMVSDGEGQNMNKVFKNVFYTSLNTETDPSSSFVSILPWKKLLTNREIQEMDLGTSHIFSKYDLARAGVISSIDIPDKQIYLTVPGLNIPSHWSHLHLIEGGQHYIANIFRSNFECRMRHSAFDERYPTKYPPAGEPTTPGEYAYETTINGNHLTLYGAPEFCKVCNYQIRNRITGYTEWGSGGIDRYQLKFVFENEIMPRIIKSFDIHNRIDPSNILSVKEAFCHLASIRAYIMFKSMPNPIDVKLNVVPIHVALYYKGIICDPTFYDLYRLGSGNEPVTSTDPDGNSELHYLTPGAETHSFKNWEVSRGFIGTPCEMRALMYQKRMRPNSFGNQSLVWVEPVPGISNGTPGLIHDNFFRETNHFSGPDNPEEYDVINDIYIGSPYHSPMQRVWQQWIEYTRLKKENRGLPSDGSLDTIKPLDMNIPISKIDSL